MRTGIVIQARLNSKRLPGKVLLPISEEKTVIEVILDAARRVKNSDIVILATSDMEIDDKLVDFVEKQTNFEIYRGSEENVLKRFCDVARLFTLDTIVRLTGDNPCIDSKVIENTIAKHLKGGYDYTYTADYPLGMNVEVVETSALLRSAKEGHTQADIEHVTFFVRNNPKLFKLNFIKLDLARGFGRLRLTLDTPSDYIMLQVLFDYLKSNNGYFEVNQIENLWKLKPYIFEINDGSFQKVVFETREAELKEAVTLLEKQEMYYASEILKKNLSPKYGIDGIG